MPEQDKSNDRPLWSSTHGFFNRSRRAIKADATEASGGPPIKRANVSMLVLGVVVAILLVGLLMFLSLPASEVF